MPLTDLPNELLLKILKDTYPPTTFNDPKDYPWCYDQDGEMKKTDITMINVSLTCHLFKDLTDKILETHVITQAEKDGGRSKPGISGWKDVIRMREFLKARDMCFVETMFGSPNPVLCVVRSAWLRAFKWRRYRGSGGYRCETLDHLIEEMLEQGGSD